MDFVARGHLERGCLDLQETAPPEPLPQRRQDAAARQQERPPVGVDIAVPPGGGVGHLTSSGMRKGLANPAELSMVRPEITGSGPESQKGIASVKVIASSLRKGNVLDIDGKLYVVMNAESFHPGKGTPTTQVDMRRISDGVKTQQRYKTTEQVERAHVEDREHQFLYQDGDGLHFMNMENYDQVTLPTDLVGDQAVYLEPEMKVMLAIHEGLPVSINLPQKTILEVVETQPATKGQTAASSYKPALLSNGVRTNVPPHIATGTRIVVMTADGSYVERAKD